MLCRLQKRFICRAGEMQCERRLPASGLLFCWCAWHNIAPVDPYPNMPSMDQPLTIFVIGKDDDAAGSDKKKPSYAGPYFFFFFFNFVQIFVS